MLGLGTRPDVGSPLPCCLESTLSQTPEVERENEFVSGLFQLLLQRAPCKALLGPTCFCQCCCPAGLFSVVGKDNGNSGWFPGLLREDNSELQLGRTLLFPLPRQAFPSVLLPSSSSPRSSRW